MGDEVSGRKVIVSASLLAAVLKDLSFISKLDQHPDRHELDEDMELALYGIRKHYDNKSIENIVIS